MLEHALRDTDVRDPHRAGVKPARQQQVPGLAAEERDALACFDGRAHNRAARAADAARQIDRDDRRGACVDRFDQRARFALDRAIEAGAEKRVDDHPGTRERLRLCRLDRPLPKLRGRRGIALQRADLSEQQHCHRIAALGEHARGHKSIAAVVAGTGDDHHARAERMARDRVGDRAPRLVHQRHAGDPARNGEPVAFGHFVRGEELDHGNGAEPSRAGLHPTGRGPAPDASRFRDRKRLPAK